MITIKKTSRDWQRYFDTNYNQKILFYDFNGWGKDMFNGFYKELIDENEFRRRLLNSKHEIK